MVKNNHLKARLLLFVQCGTMENNHMVLTTRNCVGQNKRESELLHAI